MVLMVSVCHHVMISLSEPLCSYPGLSLGAITRNTFVRPSSVDVKGDGDWIKKKMLAMFSDVTAEIFHVTPAAKLNDSPGYPRILLFMSSDKLTC